MKKLISLSLAFAWAMGICANPVTVAGPDGKLQLNVDVKGGKAVYSVVYNNKVMLQDSPLGFKSNEADFDAGVSCSSVGLCWEIRQEKNLRNMCRIM